MARAVVLGFCVAVAMATSVVAGQRSPGNDLNGDGGPASRRNWYYQQRGGLPQYDWRWRRPPQFGWPPNQFRPANPWVPYQRCMYRYNRPRFCQQFIPGLPPGRW